MDTTPEVRLEHAPRFFFLRPFCLSEDTVPSVVDHEVYAAEMGEACREGGINAGGGGDVEGESETIGRLREVAESGQVACCCYETAAGGFGDVRSDGGAETGGAAGY